MLNTTVYGTYEEYLQFLQYAEKHKKLICRQTNDYDTFLSYLSEEKPHVIFVLCDGAYGMEGVIAARNLYPQIPVVWISNDKGFGIQSYRLGCTFFSDKPLTEKKIAIALSRVDSAAMETGQENRFAYLDDRTIRKIQHSRTPTELIAAAKKHGVSITQEEAGNYFHYLADHVSEALDDEMLEKVSGGIDTNQFKLFFDTFQMSED